MKIRDYSLIFFISLIFFGAVSFFQHVPGYMDAEYYYGQGIRLVEYHDIKENFIWNFLNNPHDIPTEGFAFWLPLTSILAAAGMYLCNSTDFFAARFMFIILAALVPPLSAKIAFQFSQHKWAAWITAVIAVFSGFYLPYMTIPDTFVPYMVFGGLFFSIFLNGNKGNDFSKLYLIGGGIISGCMALTRSEGVLWLIAGGFLILWNRNNDKTPGFRKTCIYIGLFLAGFCLVMIPWYIRNFQIYQTLLPPATKLMPWLTKYEDLFVYPSEMISKSIWIETDLLAKIGSRLHALVINLQTLVVAGGAIILTPMIMIGAWVKRKDPLIWAGLGMLCIVLGVMSFIFPYAGQRGGFFHSLSSIQILLWALIPVGLEKLIQFGVLKRNWITKRAVMMFGVTLILFSLVFSTIRMIQKVGMDVEGGIPWNQTQNLILTAEKQIQMVSDSMQDRVMVNNPPGYSLATGRPSVMIPTGGLEPILQVCRQFDIRFLVVDPERQDVALIIEENDVFFDNFKLISINSNVQLYEYLSD